MNARIAHSTHPEIEVAVAEIAASLRDSLPKLVVYFASPGYTPGALASAMARAFPTARTAGCTTAGEIVSGHVLDRSLVAMALTSDIVRSVQVAVLPGLSRNARAAVQSAFSSLEAATGSPMMGLGHSRYVGLILLDGMSGAEERVLDEIGNRADIAFVGGSAGDDLQFKGTYVFADGKAMTDSGVVALLEPAVPFEVIKTQSFRILPGKLVATKVDEKRRLVLEFDDRPAVDAYAEAVGTTPDKIHEHFMRNPLGLVIHGEPYVRSPQRVVDGGIAFYCAIVSGMELSLLESTDIVADTAKAVERAKGAVALLNFNCILRTLELKNRGQCDAYARLFEQTPTIGFSTYGEAYVGHINQTATILALGSASRRRS